jgi:dnd system-associated protein 4
MSRSDSPIFKKERTIYWSAEYSDIVNLLTGLSDEGENRNGMFETNAHVMVFAACLGLNVGGGKRPVASQKKEITTQTFYSRRLDRYILLIALLGNKELGPELLKSENDEMLIKEFEGYAGRGFEKLASIFYDSPGKTPEMLIQGELLKLMKVINGGSKDDVVGVTNIFS